MSENKKQQVDVVIDGKPYSLMGVESEDYIQSIGKYIDKKIKEICTTVKGVIKNYSLFSLLVCINIADDLFKERELNRQNTHKLQKLNEITNEYKKLKAENDSLKKTLQNSKSGEIINQLNKNKTDIEKLSNENAQLRFQLNKSSETIISLKNEIVSGNEKIKIISDKFNKAQQELSHIKNEVETAAAVSVSDMDKLNNELKGAKSQALSATQQFNKLKDEFEKYKLKTAAFENLKSEYEKTKKELDNTKKEFNEYIETFGR